MIGHMKWFGVFLLLSCSIVHAVPSTDWIGIIKGLGDILGKGIPEASQPETANSEMIPELSESTTYKHLLKTLKALRLLLKYFQDNYDAINLDAIVTTRMAQDQFQVILKRFDNLSGIKSLSKEAKDAIRKDVTNFNTSFAHICDRAIPELEKSNKVYFDSAAPLLKKNGWTFDYPTRTTNTSYLYARDNLTTEFDESTSDKCYSELIGTDEHAGLPCSPTDHCWKYQTSPNSAGYRLAHQVLYLQIAEKNSGCLDPINRLIDLNNQVSTSRLIDIFCANVLQDMKDEMNTSTGVQLKNRDLFLEQAGLCGMMGFCDFFTIPQLELILSWQKEEGCYGLLITQIPEYFAYQMSKLPDDASTKIEKRVEEMMSNMCLSHGTGVALIALAGYLRYLLEDPSLTFQQ